MEIRLRDSATLDLADHFQISKSATSRIIREALDVIYINSLTANYEYSRSNRENLPLPIKMKLSKKP